jgi:hypothetical protein
MIGIDTNLLLYSLNPASEWHSGAVDFGSTGISVG